MEATNVDNIRRGTRAALSSNQFASALKKRTGRSSSRQRQAPGRRQYCSRGGRLAEEGERHSATKFIAGRSSGIHEAAESTERGLPFKR